MKKRLYLLRHGQTKFNTMGLAQGRINSDLTDLGKKQALAAKNYFEKNNIKFDHIYTSPLGRTIQTCEIVTGEKGKQVDGLIEIDFGQLDGKDYEVAKAYHDDYTSVGGESVDSAGDRMLKTLIKIMQEDNESVLVVAHATVGRAFYYKVIGKYLPSFRIPNCGISIYDFEDGKFSFVKMVDPLND